MNTAFLLAGLARKRTANRWTGLGAAALLLTACLQAQGEPPQAAERVTYGGRTLDEWQRLVCTDLEPESRAKAFAAFRAFAAQGKSAEAVAAIRAGLAIDQPAVAVQAAYDAVLKTSHDGEDLLVLGIGHQKLEHRRAAVRAAGIDYCSRKAVLLPLIKAIRDEDVEVRSLACTALEHMAIAAEREPQDGTTSTKPPPGTPTATTNGVVTAMSPALKDADASVRIAAAKSLGHLGPKAKAAVPDLVAFTQAALEDFENRRQAAMGKSGRAEASLRPVRFASFRDPGGHSRPRGHRSGGQCGDTAPHSD